MIFSSLIFLLYFFPLVFVGYYILSFSRGAQNVWLFFTSILFYAWGEPVYVWLMLGLIFLNWLAGLMLERYHGNRRAKKRILVTVSVIDIGILFFFKYINFLISNINMLADQTVMEQLSVSLPIGISFYTFQAISYVVDVYKGTTKTEKNPLYLGLYISFFPQLIAGPIVRFEDIADQIRTRKSSYQKTCVGVCRFVTGLGKKVLLSDNLAILADQIFSWSEMGAEQFQVPAVMAWVGAIAYTLQIYFDFSGYSDMAIGLALMFGFKLNENFRYPYAAASLQEFWKRWHISLTDWFHEYVYFPLGGSRVENKDTMIRNMFLVWVLTGLWHGAGWTFLFWGLWHFVFLVAERFFGYAKNPQHKGWFHLYTMLVVLIGWVIFRAKDLYQANIYFKNMLGQNQNGIWSEMTGFLLREYGCFILIGMVFSLPVAQRCNNMLRRECMGCVGKCMTVLYPVGMMLVFGLCMVYLVRGSYSPFIYFNF